MVRVKNNKITMTRGDTLRLKVGMILDDEEYTPQEGDEVRIAVKNDILNATRTDYVDAEPLILVTIPNDTLILRLDPQHTKSLPFGTYAYDIQITFADGTVDTFISNKLVLTEEVD